MINLPVQALKALEMLNSAGFEAYVVGGCVRDRLMNRPLGDIDITTSALPRQTKAVFRAYNVIETGIRHGTVTVVLDGLPVEITTYRTETGYTDGRHPDRVDFTASLALDCARRDFTINSICYNPSVGYMDFYCGQEDIENRLIRCVGRAEKRFSEDALRILRAVRFASVLGFEIEENTKQALFSCKDLLKNISAERLYAELSKLLCGDNVKQVLMEYTEILAVFIPEIMALKGFDQKNHHHIYDVLEHTAVVVENTPKQPRLRLAALLHDFGKPSTFTTDEKGTGHFYGHGEVSYEMTKTILTRLKAPGEDYGLITHLVKYHDAYIEHSEKAVRRALNKHGRHRLKLLLQLKRADNKGQNTKDFDRTEEYNRLEKLIDRQLESRRCFSLKQLAINGNHLADMGIPPSKQTGLILGRLLDMVINGEVENSPQALLKTARQLKDELL